MTTNLAHFPLLWSTEELWLLPQHAVWWPARDALLIADPHFGKAATFRAAAIPIPDDTASELQRLTSLLLATEARRLIFLGDLLHARRGRCETTFAQITAWRREHANVSMLLVRGNHDLRAGDPPEDWDLECVDEPYACGSFQLRHHPEPGNGPVLAGHLHPKIRLQGAGDDLRLPCFLLRRNVLVLPAWTRFADSGLLQRQPSDRIFAVAGDRVLEV